MAYCNILSKVDRALAAYIIANDSGSAADTFPLKSSLDKPLPCTVCFASKAKEVVGETGTWEVEASVFVRTNAAPDVNETAEEIEDASNARVAETWDLFVRNDAEALGAEITTAARAVGGDMSDFTAFDVEVVEINAGFAEKDMAWTDTIDLRIICTPSVVG